MAFTVAVTDAQVPPQFLSYSLVANPGGIPTPPGVSIDQVTGLFSWTAPTATTSSTNVFTVHVQDSGTPSLASEQTFRVFVVLAPTSVITPPAANGTLTISFGTVPGKHYRVEAKANLGDPVWTVLADNVPATGPSLSFTDNISTGPQRFYRIVLLD